MYFWFGAYWPRSGDDVPHKVRGIMRLRSIVTLCLFGGRCCGAKFPLVGLGICCCCLIVYLKPEAPVYEIIVDRSFAIGMIGIAAPIDNGRASAARRAA